MIHPRPSEYCMKCKETKECLCACHEIEVHDKTKHYFIYQESLEMVAKSEKSLEHFRDV